MFVMTVRKRKQILDSINSEIEKRHSKHLDESEQDELKKIESLDWGILSITMTSLDQLGRGNARGTPLIIVCVSRMELERQWKLERSAR
jgi:hypothetical protein